MQFWSVHVGISDCGWTKTAVVPVVEPFIKNLVLGLHLVPCTFRSAWHLSGYVTDKCNAILMATLLMHCHPYFVIRNKSYMASVRKPACVWHCHIFVLRGVWAFYTHTPHELSQR